MDFLEMIVVYSLDVSAIKEGQLDKTIKSISVRLKKAAAGQG